uniref:Uncharacterized protein n=1 Tax=Oryza nivara TaxID=4536 RepID=A0A0E0HAE5_ORYNI
MGFFSPHSRFDSAICLILLMVLAPIFVLAQEFDIGNSDEFCQCQACLGRYTLLADEENPRLAMFERRLPFFGCGIGWCCFLLGFLCPLIWYIAALLYYCKYYNRDPRERPGLAASAFLAVIFTAATIVTLSVLLIIIYGVRFA